MNRRIQGFSLMELALVMIVAGTLFGIVTFAFSMYNLSQKQAATSDSLRYANSAILEFLGANGGIYPCPASPLASPGDPDYGVADCAGAGVITVPGRDVDGDGTAEGVLIGALPFETLFPFLDNLSNANANVKDGTYASDGWGNKLTYAVTVALTAPLTFNKSAGAIDIVDEFNQSVLQQPGTAHWVILSHGPDGYGAFPTGGGGRNDTCGVSVVLPTPPPMVTVPTLEQHENCDDDDATFLSGLRNDTDTYKNDDSLTFMLDNSDSLWRYTSLNTATNTNVGNVGVGQDNPTEKLHVGGDVRARAVIADRLCSGNNKDMPMADPPDCLPLENMVTGALDCGPGQVLRAFDRNNAVCEAIIPPGTSLTCPVPGQVVVAIVRSASGVTLECNPLP